MSEINLGRSLTTLDAATKAISSHHEASFNHFIKTSIKDENSILIAISDNHNISQKDRLGPSGRKVQDGMNTLVKALPHPTLQPISLSNPFITPVDPTILIGFLNTIEESSSYVDPYFEGTHLPVNLNFPHLSSYNPHPFLLAKSSSKKDVDKVLMKGIMEEKLQCDKRPAALVVDPEPYNLVMGMVQADGRCGERWKYLIPMIGLFHLRMHFCSGTLLDPSNYILAWNRLLPHMIKSAFEIDWVRMKVEAFRRYTPHDEPMFKNRIKLIKHFLSKNTQPTTPLPTGTEVIPDLLNNHPHGDEATFTDKKMMAVFHLLWLLGNEPNGTEWTSANRGFFTYWTDPKKNVKIMRTVHHCWKEVETEDADKRVEAEEKGEEVKEDGVGVAALRKMMEEIELFVIPFDNLFQHGDASSFFSLLPKMIFKISKDHHPTLLRGYLPFLHLLNHWKETNPGIIEFISSHIHSLSDGVIENFNSSHSTIYGKHSKLSGEGVKCSVAMTAQKSVLREEMRWRKIGDAEGKSEYVQIYGDSIRVKVKEELAAILNDCRSGERYCIEGIDIMGDKYRVGKEKAVRYLQTLTAPVPISQAGIVDISEELKPFKKSGLLRVLQHLQEEYNEVRFDNYVSI